MLRTREQIRLALLQPRLCVLQGISLLQEHPTSFSKSYGAKGCHWEELLEKLHVKVCVVPNNVVKIFKFASIILHFVLIISSGWGEP